MSEKESLHITHKKLVCKTCGEDYEGVYSVPHFCKENHGWIIGNIIYHSYQKKTLHNRFKWWIGTKLFLPGKSKWL